MVNGHGICHGGYIYPGGQCLRSCITAATWSKRRRCPDRFFTASEAVRPAIACAKVVHQGGRAGVYDVAVMMTGNVARFRGNL